MISGVVVRHFKGVGLMPDVTDFLVRVRSKCYLIECQSTDDGSMVVRLADYTREQIVDDLQYFRNLLANEFENGRKCDTIKEISRSGKG